MSLQSKINKVLKEINKKPIAGEKTPILSPSEFLQRISSFLFHFPHQYLYVVHFSHIPPSIVQLSQIAEGRESEEPRSYFHDEFGNNFLSDNKQNQLTTSIINSILDNRGCCWFANDMSLPGEKLSISNGEMMSNSNRGGLMGGPTIQSRHAFDELKLAFLETNASFGDLVIRPWIKLVGHAGTIARDADDPLNAKVDCWITFYSKTKSNSHLVPRKTYFFKDLMPISLNGETKTYSDNEIKSESRTATFTYSYYNVASELGNYSYE